MTKYIELSDWGVECICYGQPPCTHELPLPWYGRHIFLGQCATEEEVKEVIEDIKQYRDKRPGLWHLLRAWTCLALYALVHPVRFVRGY